MELGSVVREERLDDLDRLFEAADAFARSFEFDAVCPVLVDLPTGTEAEDEAAVRELIECRGAVRKERRMVHRRR